MKTQTKFNFKMSLTPQNTTIIQTDNSTVTYQPEFLTDQESKYLYEYFLNNLNWQHDTAKIYGKTIVTKRQIAWFADSNLKYNYSGTNRVADGIWDEKVLRIKEKLEKTTGFTFNSCLLNLYHNGSEGMAWHSNDQNHLDPEFTTVAIISIGAERFFKLRETIKRDNQYKVTLEQGSLLLMLNQTQKYWQHEIPKMAAIKVSRISLTWRTMAKNKIKITV
jgi:alkylated DNA repair dioxygenase AlkB